MSREEVDEQDRVLTSRQKKDVLSHCMSVGLSATYAHTVTDSPATKQLLVGQREE